MSFRDELLTVISCQILFENDKIFKKDLHLWGVISVKQSSVNMVPSKVEISLRKADQVAWGKLEDPNYVPEPEPVDISETVEPQQPDWDIDDDDISESDEEWAYDTPKKTAENEKDKEQQQKKDEDMQNMRRKEVEREMKRAAEERKEAEEARKRLEEQRRQEEEGYEDMPDLE